MAQKLRLKKGRLFSMFFEHLILLGIPTVIILVIAVLFHFTSISRHKSSIKRTIEHWKIKYDLTDEQMKSINNLEIRYHGNGSPFSPITYRDQNDKMTHYRELSIHFPPHTVDAFLQDVSSMTPH